MASEWATDWRVREFWQEVMRAGPMGLTRMDWQTVTRNLDATTVAIFKRVLEQVEAEAKWVAERTAAMRDEAERITLIGQTMKRAGLRSYTDKDGRIFVAEDR